MGARLRWPTIDPRLAMAALVLFVAVGLVQGGALGLVRAHAAGLDRWRPVAWHVTGALGAWAALPAVLVALATARGRRWPAALGVHAFGWVAFTTVHTLVLLGTRALGGALVGVDLSADGSLVAQLGWEAQADLVLYPGLAALLGLLQARGDQQRAAQRAAELELRLAQARLETLTARLDPHFLFNALNTVGAVMYEDLERSEALLASLGELLRAGLRAAGPTWTLAEERRHLAHYVALARARFEGRLRIAIEIADGLDAASVPRSAITDLVENAIKHNRGLERPLTIAVEVRGGEALTVSVRDDGVGFGGATGTDDPAHGLGRLRELLRLLYGERASLRCDDAAGGGAAIELRVPLGGPA